MAKNTFKVVIPQNAEAFITLINNIVNKEQSGGGMLTAAELAMLVQLRNAANTANDEQKELMRQAEEKTRARDLAFGRADGQGVNTPNTCEYFVTKVRDKALADNKENPKAIGAWGFEVNESTRKKKEEGEA